MDEDIEFVEFPYEEVTFKTTLTKKFANRKPYTPPDPNKVIAFIPGTIVKVFVKDGKKVKKGEALLVLAAMKMENHLLAPKNGVVKKIYVKQGEVVPKNFLLVELK
jgi:biotin carboxyl carrier protein